jgi:large subunit ribosomal protein L35
MPKRKTSRSAAKRYRITGAGHVKRGRPYAGHLLDDRKSRKRKRGLRQNRLVHASDERRALRLIGKS